MDNRLSDIEVDFVEFISQKTGRDLETTKKIFLETKNRFKFVTPKYTKFSGQIQSFFRILYEPVNEQRSIESYQFHGLLHLFRYISYSYPKPFSVYIREILSMLRRGQFRNIAVYGIRLVKNKFKGILKNKDVANISTAQLLVKGINGSPVIVDYGSGLAYTSFEIGKLAHDTKVYLVDMPTITLEFSEFRFKKHGISVETIPVTIEDPYPKLPKHNICIASEVMEHLIQPLSAYSNVHDSLEVGGVLYGNFEDHEKGTFHVSYLLHDLREKIAQDFEKTGHNLYKKIK